MDFIYGHGLPCLHIFPFQALIKPGPVLPLISVEIRHDRGALRPHLGGIAIGVCLVNDLPVSCLDCIFVKAAHPYPGNKSVPDT